MCVERREQMLYFSDMIQCPDVGRMPDYEVIKGRIQISKADDEKQYAFGWASVSVQTDGEQVVDWQKDMIDPEDLVCGTVSGRRRDA